ncbi:RagB/SusD family nutrient uptake outer membrane protein [Lutibacter sp. A80]|uniref:RagB/SusD family nutrient uptake outer membrane protein n=1 Tax=Lutibacter sp. A80 TaxID=2918453 RepID=UPI001F05D386|nr:RagB/SusD family nutrient uptake outer membrane protein [Lutibacter sp. A80]UMB61930.1 RagB/SusD family nutrient uptake outer membrane protein [Lutibacter sp. A80]
MKKIFIKLTIVCLIAVTAVSCGKDYLNDPAPTDAVTSDVIFGSRTGAEAFMSGILRLFRAQYTDNDSAGLNSIYYARTVKGNDVIQGPTWFLYDYENANREPTYRRTTFTWNFCFDMINQTNSFINGVQASELSDIDKAELIGQGKAIRAFYYFQLAMEFQHTYSYDSSLPAPPIYTELSLDGKPMSTLQEMYDLIISDLTTAIEELPDTRLGKSYINKAVANGILARVYQTTGNWSGAEAAARAAYGGDPASVLNASSYQNGFNDISNVEWIWGMPQSDDQSNYYWGAPHSHADHYVLSYQGTYFNNDFVSLFSNTDVRNMFENGYGVEESSYQHNITTKFAFTFDADHPIIRSAEMILVEAEAKYYNGDETGAHNLLWALQSNRDANAVKSSNTGSDLLEEILVERRKELYAEIGVEWFDAKRYRRGITRTGNHRVGSSANLLPDDKKFFLKIPQEEIDANENIDASVNADR